MKRMLMIVAAVIVLAVLFKEKIMGWFNSMGK